MRNAGKWAVLVLGAMTAPAAMALEEGWSFEVAMGQARFTDVKAADIDPLTVDFFSQFELEVGPGGTSSVKTRDRSYALITSYRLNEHWGFDTGYFRLGAFQYGWMGTVGGQGNFVPGSFNLSFRAKGILFGAMYSYRLGEIFEVRGRGGISTSDTRLKYSATVQATTVADALKASSQDFYFGVGVGANIGDYYRVGIDWMRHRNMGKPSLTYRADVDNIMASFSYMY